MKYLFNLLLFVCITILFFYYLWVKIFNSRYSSFYILNHYLKINLQTLKLN